MGAFHIGWVILNRQNSSKYILLGTAEINLRVCKQVARMNDTIIIGITLRSISNNHTETIIIIKNKVIQNN